MTAASPKPAQLLAEAETLYRGAEQGAASYWARASAFLARSALESAVNTAVTALDPHLPDATMRSKLLLLPLLTDELTATTASRAWSGLSRACHQHPYELAPTHSELARLVHDVRKVLTGLSP